MDPVRGTRIVRYEAGAASPREDRVTVEEPLEIRIGGETLAVTMRTPGHDFDLAAGWLLSEGIVRRPEEIVRIEHCREVRSEDEEGNVVIVRATTAAGNALDRAKRLLLTSSSCGLCGKGSIESIHGRFPPVDSDARVSPEVLGSLPATLRRSQAAFAETGGLHAAGDLHARGRPSRLARGHRPAQRGRQGHRPSLPRRAACPCPGHVLLVSGRASFEIVQKAVAAGIPILAAVSAPSSLAIDLARESRVALVGFLREGGFNLYSAEERLAVPASAR